VARKKKGTDPHTKIPPIETKALRRQLTTFLKQEVDVVVDTATGRKEKRRLGKIQFGVYAFYDYADEPIYTGRTRETLGSRIGRHLTNQRTDAVAMSVLDPYEVRRIQVFPLAQYVETKREKSPEGRAHLNALEYQIFQDAIKKSAFKAILNEEEPAKPATPVEVPESFEMVIVPEDVEEIRGHPDTRIARRAQTLARLAQTISERKVSPGLRKTLLTQTKRLNSLAQERYDAWFKEIEASKIKVGEEDEDEQDEHEEEDSDKE
jgi:hypothetical protein